MFLCSVKFLKNIMKSLKIFNVSSLILDNEEIQLVMVGQSQGGKSMAANSIIGEEVFMSGSETLGCTVARRTIDGKGVLVVDTPGLFSKVKEDGAVLRELKDPSNALMKPSTTFVVTMRMDRKHLSDEEEKMLNTLQDPKEPFHDKIDA